MTAAVDRPPVQSERQFQRAVMDLARWRKWLVFHDQDSRRNPAGMPDLVMVRSGRLVFAELKSETGTFRADQRVWLNALREVRGVEVYCWRPSSWPEVERVLS